MTYEELVEGINQRLISGGVYHPDFECKKGIQMKEVNAWTYWQGLGVRHPRIIVLGQDWGSSLQGDKYFKAIDEMIQNPINTDNRVQYFKYYPGKKTSGKEFDTDEELAKGLAKLGYQHVKTTRYKDLFFTNLIPGFRKNPKSTGGFKSGWINEQIKKDFLNLLDILQPWLVICLGKNTFVHCMKFFHKDVLHNMSWNKYLDSCPDPIEVSTSSGAKIYFAAVQHPGYFGAMNRKKYGNGKNIDDDWDRIDSWLKNNPRKIY